MDFLLLLPHGQRVVLEVDGSHHFTSLDGQPDATKYADELRGDRGAGLAAAIVRRRLTLLVDDGACRPVTEFGNDPARSPPDA